MLRSVQDLILALAAGRAGVTVDAVQAVVLGDPAGVVQGRFPRGGDDDSAIVLRTLDRSRVPLRGRMRGTVPGGRIVDRILDPGGDDHRSSSVRVLSRRRAHHGVALLQSASRAIIVLLTAGFSRRWLVLRRQHVRQHRPFFLHLDDTHGSRRKFSMITGKDGTSH